MYDQAEVQLQQVEQWTRRGLLLYPPNAGPTFEHRYCQLVLERILALRYQFVQHRVLCLPGPFFPAHIIQRHVDGEPMECAYVTFGSFSSPIYFGHLPSKGVCWIPYGADPNDLDQWHTIQEDNLPHQASFSGDHSVFHRALIIALRSPYLPFDQFLSEVQLRSRGYAA
eukprot:TRINITY_DN6188_c0_g2_i1.p1 TRINITY_DN6188_c0_g2~~TRINITY_DN6188_c0_g2_i1.p1  ORF type:complete len:169 (+),score=21.41 TRINITY_DN6188_c0_g2_i1:84-590(+)